MKAGEADITATTVDGGFTATRHVIVWHFVPVSSIEINPSIALVVLGTKVEVAYTVNPSDATIKNLDWKSSNTSVLSIIENSTSDPDNPPSVRALKVGTAILTATARDGSGVKAEIGVAVVATN